MIDRPENTVRREGKHSFLENEPAFSCILPHGPPGRIKICFCLTLPLS